MISWFLSESGETRVIEVGLRRGEIDEDESGLRKAMGARRREGSIDDNMAGTLVF